jgi:hypothetical protein
VNRAQRVVLVVGIVLLVLEIIFPPFKWSAGGKTWAARHGFILSPPEPLELTVGTTAATVDVGRWIAHAITLVGATAVGLLLFRSWSATSP